MDSVTQDNILIRNCDGFDELASCVALQVEVWGYSDGDVIPRRVFLVTQKIGGQVIGAFDTSLPRTSANGDDENLVGFAMALPGIRDGQPYLHSHMLAVRPSYRNRGIGRRLKLAQREDALARKIVRMEWTFDPLEIKNAFLNINRLGAIARCYTPDFYGVSSSRLQGGLPTDRLHAEWWMDSDRVLSTLAGSSVVKPAIQETIVVTNSIGEWKSSPQKRHLAVQLQTENRQRFQRAFAAGLAVVGFERDTDGNGIFQLGVWQESAVPEAQPIEKRD